MAKPIKEIPVLRGDDARNFSKAIERNQKISIPRADYDRAVNAYKSIKLRNYS